MFYVYMLLTFYVRFTHIRVSGYTFRDRDKTINYITNECSKLAQEFKNKHDWVDKVIPWEMCKNFEFDHMNKWYMLILESVLEKKMHKLLWDFEIETNY